MVLIYRQNAPASPKVEKPAPDLPKHKCVSDRQAALIVRIRGFVSRSGIRKSTFGKRAVGDVSLLDRIYNGGQLRDPTMDKIEAFLNQQERGYG